MNSLRFTLRLVAALALVALGNSLALAQGAARTWVSAVGADANPCSRTAPCQTFTGALAKTQQNGEINVLDPGSYGSFTIVKSVTVDAGGNYAGILASATTGILISLNPAVGNTDVVHTIRLRGLDISGAGNNAKTGLRGINVLNTNFTDLKVVVENTTIDGFLNEGILYSVNGGDLIVKNSILRNNDVAGIKVDSSGVNIAHVSVANSSMVLNGDGIIFEDNVRGAVSDSVISNNVSDGAVVANQGTPSVMQIERTVIASNRAFGVLASGTVNFGTATLSECMVVHNSTGLQSNAGGQIRSFGHNRVVFNLVADGAFTAPTILEQ
ncbi:MAG TPA: right-handed parallel beta-helix repeat-containing protein [Pyrinomonadaceae bacterium]|jgi:hypothetical protein|nr:right-handed parallel beta-helix repeat-containing protein [Pyrinomonadaceae bacterium]